MSGDILSLLFVNACLFAAGAGVTRALGAWRRPSQLLTINATSFLAGAATYGVCAQLLFVLGLSLSRVQCVSLCALLPRARWLDLPR